MKLWRFSVYYRIVYSSSRSFQLSFFILEKFHSKIIKCSDCQAPYIGETGRNLRRRLTEHKRATRNGDVNNHILSTI